MKTPALKRAQKKYEKNVIKRVELKLNKRYDGDIIEFLESKDNVNGYLKELIRKDKGEG